MPKFEEKCLPVKYIIICLFSHKTLLFLFNYLFLFLCYMTEIWVHYIIVNQNMCHTCHVDKLFLIIICFNLYIFQLRRLHYNTTIETQFVTTKNYMKHKRRRNK